jgi:hypothetical protein
MPALPGSEIWKKARKSAKRRKFSGREDSNKFRRPGSFGRLSAMGFKVFAGNLFFPVDTFATGLIIPLRVRDGCDVIPFHVKVSYYMISRNISIVEKG